MKKILVLSLLLLVSTPFLVLAQESGTDEEERMGQKLTEDLATKKIECRTIKDDQFEKIGEFYMGRMAGAGHESMNTMMQQMMGKEGEEAMHVTMGKRMSGCDTSATMGMMQGSGMMGGMMGGMMSGMMGGYTQQQGNGGTMGPGQFGSRSTWSMMPFWGAGASWLGWLAMSASGLFWVLMIVLLIGLVRWVWKK